MTIDRIAIVTGAARGIGAAIATRLASDGAAVAVLDLDADSCAPVVDQIAAAGGRAIAVGADVADESWAQGDAVRLEQLRLSVLGQRFDLLLELAGLQGVATPIGGFSRGMKQRLGVAQAMINSPRLLILDEPTSALDPMGRHDVLNLITALRGSTTIFFSTHILSDVERVCDRVLVLASGRVVAADRTEALRARYGGSQKLRVELVEQHAALPEALVGERWLTGLERRGEAWMIDVIDMTAAHHRLPGIVASQGWGLRRLEPVEASLEDAFVRLIGAEGG